MNTSIKTDNILEIVKRTEVDENEFFEYDYKIQKETFEESGKFNYFFTEIKRKMYETFNLNLDEFLKKSENVKEILMKIILENYKYNNTIDFTVNEILYFLREKRSRV